MEKYHQEIDAFVRNWPQSSLSSKECFQTLWQFMQGLSEARIEFHGRPGVSYSLRGVHQRQTDRPLFVMIDVIDDEPRWLSVCFYGQSVTDPEQLGDLVPGGLLGEDGMCFDLEGLDPELLEYVQQRIVEAYTNAV